MGLQLRYVCERKKIKRTNLGLAEKDKQLYERKLCSFFAKPQKQIGVVFSSITKCNWSPINALS
jgi:hypothetical protein